MTLIIREAMEKDVDIISEFILALSYHQNLQQYVLTDVRTLREHGFGKDRLFGTLLAEIDGTTVGYLTYIWNYSTWAGGHYMYIENIFVLERRRRLGVGVALMEEAKRICEENGCLSMKWEVEPDNENAIAFYKKLGANIALRGIGSCTIR